MSNPIRMNYKKLAKESMYQGFFELNRYTFCYEMFKGGWSQPFQREVFERGHAAAVLLLDPVANLLVLVEQFRPGAVETEADPWLLELVAGIIEENEKPEDVVFRESVEEAGCEVKNVTKICEYLVSPGGTTERIWLYLGEIDASRLPEYAGLEEENEDIKIHKIPVSKAFEMLDGGEINNAMTLISLQWLKLHWHEKESFFS
ncbi:NUDIX domain-containing protein [Aliikangiella coralliicola]|uniref:ADP-ribose pyrophosphatase n=1 Tax=Aliikangiella coralliicola TaxID=2592383 RepID=A0A545UBZ6_9GAMM|nr:NUDIX domain-containing protein [Aliikangiella coralliicola]TQV86988.1 NUDIX domain-containing protein [Aliikangiella coralliicola]